MNIKKILQIAIVAVVGVYLFRKLSVDEELENKTGYYGGLKNLGIPNVDGNYL